MRLPYSFAVAILLTILLPVLHASAFTIDPTSGTSADPLAGRNGCGVANHRHDVTMPARLRTQNAKAILCVVVSDALYEARRQYFLACYFRLRLHVS